MCGVQYQTKAPSPHLCVLRVDLDDARQSVYADVPEGGEVETSVDQRDVCAPPPSLHQVCVEPSRSTYLRLWLVLLRKVAMLCAAERTRARESDMSRDRLCVCVCVL